MIAFGTGSNVFGQRLSEPLGLVRKKETYESHYEAEFNMQNYLHTSLKSERKKEEILI